MSKRTKWLILGGLGAVLFGSGLCISIECAFLKHSDAPWYYWVVGGTAGIGIALAGVVVLIRAGILEMQIKQESDKN